MPQLFTNNARALLASGITDSATAMTVEASKADLFPTANADSGSVPSANNWFKVTLQDADGNVEIVYVRTRTAGSGIMSNLMRGQEGTTARAFSAGTVVGLRITAADVEGSIAAALNSMQVTGNQTVEGTKTFNGPIIANGGVQGNVTGNAGTVTNGVYTTGDQTIGGVKTFSSAPVVPDDAFTFAKLQNIATATILGRSTAGTGDVEALTVLPAVSGANLTNLNATNLASGTVPTARLGSGTADSTTFLRGDGTWATVSSTPSTADVLNATAGAAVGAVGTYAFLLLVENAAAPADASVVAGSTRAGSSLRYANAAGSADGTNNTLLGGSGSVNAAAHNVSGTPSGTWRLMGYVKDYDTVATARSFTGSLWLRIS